MAEYNINKIKLPNGDIVKLVDETSGYAKSSEVPTVVDTYSSTGTDAVSGKAVNAALQTLDSLITATTGEAISAITITDGKISGSSKISVGDANQNAFSNVKVGSSTIAADTTTDTLELVAGTDITLTPDTTNDKVTIAFNNNSGYTKNTGTVTSVGLQNATNGGLSVTGSPITSSGTISVGHSNVLTNAQTTQALYPIAIDKNGHISSYGTAVDPEDIFLFEVTGTQSQGSSTINYTTTATPAQIADALSEGKIPVAKVTVFGISAYHYYSSAFEQSNLFHYMFTVPFDGGDSFIECIANSASASSFTEIYVSTSEYSYASHVHGNITTDGKISSTAVTPDNGDYILISDSSGDNKIERGIAIGTGTTKYLREDGTWQTVSSTDTITGWYGTSSTTASTAEKAVTCTNYVLNKGNIIGVLFSTANTAATPTLNVNSTGAKSIYVGASTPSSTTNVLKWSANTMVYFMYDGTYYRYLYATASASVTPPRGANVWYGTGSVAAGTQAKTATIDNYVLTKGSLIAINSSTANTYTSAKITLNINSTGAKDVYKNNAVTSSTNTLLWDANTTLLFVYDGTGYAYLGSSRDTQNLGTVTSVTASGILSSSGGTTPAITHNAPATSPATSGDAAVYPIKIDSYGHIIEKGSAVTIPGDTKVKLTSVTSSSEYPLIVGPTSITSGTAYEANYNSSVTLNASSQQLTLKAVKLVYDSNCYATMNINGYSGTTTENTPNVTFYSLKGNFGDTSNHNVYLKGVATPSSDYDAANKKYVDTAVSAISDTKVTNTLATTTQYYVTGTTSSSTNTGTQYFDTGVFVTTTAGQLQATSYKVTSNATIQYNSTDSSIDFVF